MAPRRGVVFKKRSDAASPSGAIPQDLESRAASSAVIFLIVDRPTQRESSLDEAFYRKAGSSALLLCRWLPRVGQRHGAESVAVEPGPLSCGFAEHPVGSRKVPLTRMRRLGNANLLNPPMGVKLTHLDTVRGRTLS